MNCNKMPLKKYKKARSLEFQAPGALFRKKPIKKSPISAIFFSALDTFILCNSLLFQAFYYEALHTSVTSFYNRIFI